MTLQACYAAMEGDCAQALAVLGDEERVRRYLLRFLREPTARMLFLALEEERWADAFRAAHTLKGLCRGLGLSRLHGACRELTDALRGGHAPENSAAILRVQRDYEAAMRAISALEEAK